jgi:hypothetical protein
VATFSSLQINDPGEGYKLRAEIPSPATFVESEPFDVSAATFAFGGFDGLSEGVEGAVTVNVDAEGHLDPSTLVRYRLRLTDDLGDPISGQSFTYCQDGPACTASEVIGPTDSNGEAWFGPVSGVQASAAGITDPGGATSHFLVTPEASGGQQLELILLDWTNSAEPVWLADGLHQYNVAVP